MTASHVRIFVTVGTDHHQFDRLIGWVEGWTPPEGVAVDVLVQHGATTAPVRARAVPFLSPAELRDVLTRADVVVTQGGPGGIMDARRAGRLPVVVPRLAALGEVVDDHQVAFTQHLAALGAIRRVTTREAFDRAMDDAVRDPSTVRCTPLADTAAAASRAVERVVCEVIAARRRRHGLIGRLPSLPSPRRQTSRP
jgi:UDP-N-acetylglucosamine transferase subunit ALG13